ncbi:hypothetical protein HZH66_006842 [Vespula vulgaris]|uniref:Uncharacterized protein n=3 Tax=Vespula TaxID=7451 RepID=A0A834P2M3_VESPE|nr:hypothetical protein HZH66_006842 [Vespula vulgaris]KAF7425766.1 hypothetical protein H0235_008204 [Vespula pensylvanica]
MFWGLRLEANCLCASSCMHLALMVATSRSTDYSDHPTTTNTTTIAIIVTIGQYEFIVYTERPLIHIRKLIVLAVNYSACTAATAAAKPHVQAASVQAPFQSEYASSH